MAAASSRTRRSVAGPRYVVGVVLACVTAIFLFGGASRVDSFALVPARAVAIIAVGVLLLAPMPGWWPRARLPLLFVGAVAALILLQLVPLPPVLWQSLPGRGDFAGLSVLPDMAHIWRPIAVEPDLALNVLMSLLPVVAAIVALAMLPPDRYRILVLLLIGLILASGMVGMFQTLSGSNPALYPHRVSNLGGAAGLFANRNHQALALALAFPLLAVWTVQRRAERGGAAEIPLLFLGLLFVSLILVTGSRAGLLLMVVGVAGATAMLYRRASGRTVSPRSRMLARALPVIAIGVAIALVILSNAEAMRRLFDEDISGDTRAAAFGPILGMIWHYFPVGAGVGSFADVFRIHEPLALLKPTYLNHAHNELLELALDAGLPGLLLLAAFLFWWARATMRLWRGHSKPGRGIAYGRCGSIITAQVMAASLIDYPLRTPAVAMIFAISCCWMHFGQDTRESEGARPLPR